MSVPCSGFDNSVQAIATYYRTFTTFNPPLSSLLRSTEFHKIFWNSLEHDLFVVRQRSQDLAEHEITIIQKALVLLMNNSEDQISAANLYADEILGVVYLPATAKSDALETAVRARALALESTHGQDAQSPVLTAATSLMNISHSSQEMREGMTVQGGESLRKLKTRNEPLFVFHGSKNSQTTTEHHDKMFVMDSSGDQSLKPQSEDEKLKRLLVLYYKAKNDFNATPPKSLDRTRSAKFLRDTIENCLTYIAAHQPTPDAKNVMFSNPQVSDHRSRLEELKKTLAEAIAVAEAGSGGKKRRFDENWENVPLAPSKMKGHLAARLPLNADPVPRGHASEKILGPSPVTRRHDPSVPQAPHYRDPRIPQTQRTFSSTTAYYQPRFGTVSQNPSVSPYRYRALLEAPPERHGPRSAGGQSIMPNEQNTFRTRWQADTYRPLYH